MRLRISRSWLLPGLIIWVLAAIPGGAAETPGTLTLREALRLAWKANPTIKVSKLEELIAGEEVVRARSGFFPKVKSEVSQTILDNPTKIQIQTTGPVQEGASFPLTNRNYWSTKVSIDQTLFDFWATPSRYQAAVLGKAATRLDTAQTRDNIFLTVAQGYFRVLRAEKLVIVARQEVAQLKNHLQIARDQFEFGVVTYNDVLQAEVSLADAEQRLIIAKNDVVNLRSGFNKVLGLPVAAATVLKDEKDLAAPDWELEGATARALKRRSDLQASQDRIHQGEKVITQTRAGHFPRFFAQAGHTYQENDVWVNGSQYFAIIGMQWNLFSGLDTRAQVAQARERLRQLKVRHQDLTAQVRLDVQTSYLGLKETADRIRVTKKAVTQGEENLRLNEERYREQVGTATNVIDAQTLLTRTRVNYFNALYDHQMAKAQMLWAVGAINDLLSREKPPHAR